MISVEGGATSQEFSSVRICHRTTATIVVCTVVYRLTTSQCCFRGLTTEAKQRANASSFVESTSGPAGGFRGWYPVTSPDRAIVSICLLKISLFVSSSYLLRPYRSPMSARRYAIRNPHERARRD